MYDEIRKLKKVELHLHLDGSLNIDRLADNKEEMDILKEKMIAPDKCANLSEYLTKFDKSIEYLQTRENLVLCAKELTDYLEKENIIYAEIRFAPMFHTKKGLSYDEVVASVLEGLNYNKKVKTNLILCMMRGVPKENNLKTIDVALKYLNKGVCGIDLAGAEDKYPLSEYIDLFKIASEKNIPFTIHAGENGSYKEVLLAIQLGARRIGHGIHSIESFELQEELQKKNILLEICPTSNVQTNSIDKYENHPIYDFYKQDIKVCVNTDNKTVSNISLSNEYIKLYNNFNFSIDDFKKMNINAIEGAFISEKEREQLKKELI